MGSVLTLEHIGKARPLAQCGMEELAVHQLTARPSGGVLFARTRERGEKDEARRAIVDLLGDCEAFPRLSMLTMPGLEWRFENKLLGRREGDWINHKGPARTNLMSIENDRAIYYAAVTQMPGMRAWKNRKGGRNALLSQQSAPDYAERSVGNVWVNRFYLGNVDDMLRDSRMKFDAAWLDYTGPMSVQRLALIAAFFQANIRAVLIITVLKARWNRETVAAIEHAGGHSQWLRRALPGEVLHEINYQDSASPMTQIAIRRGRDA